MLNYFRKLLKPKYEPLNKIEIIKKNILDNFSYLQGLQSEAEIFPVLKSNAYGHGLKEVAKILNESPAKMVIVDSFPEAQIVYKNFKGRVLILGEMPKRAYAYCKFKRTEFCVYNEATFIYLAKNFKQVKIHLFVNTGMNREGINNLTEFLDKVKEFLPRVEIVGLCSHLASREAESNLNDAQEKKFFNFLDILHTHKIFPKWIHLGNSAGIFTLKNKGLTAFRAGISLYGYNVFKSNHSSYKSAEKLKPALRLLSTIIGSQKLLPGETVSYNETYKAKKETNIALVPFGYYEGLDRRLSNKAEFKILTDKPFMAQIAGRVCMNLSCLEANNSFKTGDRVEIISVDKSSLNSIENLANISETISYEVLIKLVNNIHREII